MSHFIRVSPSVRCMIQRDEDPVVTLSKKTMEKLYPEIPKVERALHWNIEDYRTGVRVWQSEVGSTFLSFMGPRTKAAIRRFSGKFPVTYNYVWSWFACVAFNDITGFSVRIEDERGGGCFVPKCDMLDVARREYGEDVGNRICTHVCKVFTEEFMNRQGMPCTLEPDRDKGTCMFRGVAPRKTAFSDHTTAWWLDPPMAAPAAKVSVNAKRSLHLRTL